MSLLSKLRLCLLVLCAHRARDWRFLVRACQARAEWAGLRAILTAIAQAEALESERAQVAAGTRLTRTAARLLAEAEALTQPKKL